MSLRETILDFYDENWRDYNAMYGKLVELLHECDEEIATLKAQMHSDKATPPQQSLSQEPSSDKDAEIARLNRLLRDCQDHLDEERHQI